MFCNISTCRSGPLGLEVLLKPSHLQAWNPNLGFGMAGTSRVPVEDGLLGLKGPFINRPSLTPDLEFPSCVWHLLSERLPARDDMDLEWLRGFWCRLIEIPQDLHRSYVPTSCRDPKTLTTILIDSSSLERLCLVSAEGPGPGAG